MRVGDVGETGSVVVAYTHAYRKRKSVDNQASTEAHNLLEV
jgi:hypothetical protein